MPHTDPSIVLVVVLDFARSLSIFFDNDDDFACEYDRAVGPTDNYPSKSPCLLRSKAVSS